MAQICSQALSKLGVSRERQRGGTSGQLRLRGNDRIKEEAGGWYHEEFLAISGP